MQRSFFACLLVVIVLFPLSGCRVVEGLEFIPEQAFLDESVDLSKNTATPAELLIQSTAVPISAGLNEIQEIQQVFSCGQNLCLGQWQGWLNRPFNNPDRDQIDHTYPYASTGGGRLAIHHGVEFPNPSGTLVRAAAEGEVIVAGSDDHEIFGPYENFYGNVVILRHEKLFNSTDLFTLYGHLSAVDVSEGDILHTGEVLGRVGATGVAGGSHLHFEVRYRVNDYDATTNPVLWFKPLGNQLINQTGIIAGLISNSLGDPLPEVSITLQRLNSQGEVEKQYFFETYAQDGVNVHPALNENFSISDLPPGDYRLTFYSGKLYEQFLTLEPGMLGFINVQTN